MSMQTYVIYNTWTYYTHSWHQSTGSYSTI